VVATAQGLSTASLGRSPAPADAAAPEPSAPGALAVALVDIEDGTLRYLDRTSRPPVETLVADVDFQASDLAPDTPVRFEMEAAVLGASAQNLRASGSVGPPGAAEPQIDVAATLDPLDLAQAFASAPLAGRLPAALAGSGRARAELRAKGAPADLAIEARIDAGEAELRLGDGFRKPPGSPLSLSLEAHRRGDALEIGAGDLVVDATRLALRGALEDPASPRLRLRVTSESAFPASFGAGGEGDVLRDLALEGTLVLPGGSPRLTAVLRSPSGSLRGLDYRDLELDARLRDRKLEVSKLALAAHQGTLVASGSAELGGAPAFETRLAVDGVRLESLLAAYAPSEPARASGSLTARLALRGAGASRDAILRSLAGGGDLGVADGVLRGFNPAGDSLRALSGLPIFADRKIVRLFELHPQVFGAEDTPFERIEAQIEVAGGQVVAREARLVARDYAVTGRGSYEIGGSLDSSAVMAFSPELSEAVVDAEKRLRFLRSPEGRVEFPVVIRGAPGDLSVQPDLAYVAKSASREALTDAVERVLVGKRREPAEPGAEGSEQEPEAGEQPPASVEDVGREILRRGLGGLLGGGEKD
jgi:hypothetical protein